MTRSAPATSNNTYGTSMPDSISHSQLQADILVASCIPGDGTSFTVIHTDHAKRFTELPYYWDIELLVTGQASVVTDSDRFHYLTHSYQGKEFVTYEVRKKGSNSAAKGRASKSMSGCPITLHKVGSSANTASCVKPS